MSLQARPGQVKGKAKAWRVEARQGGVCIKACTNMLFYDTYMGFNMFSMRQTKSLQLLIITKITDRLVLAFYHHLDHVTSS